MRENRRRHHQKMYFTIRFSDLFLHGVDLYPVPSKIYRSGAGNFKRFGKQPSSYL